MKKILYSILFLFAFIGAVNAQVLPNDFYISGQVTRSSDNTPIANKLVEVWRDTINGSGGGYYATAYTNNSGNYNFYITNGSVVGPNQVYKVRVYDCQNFGNVQTTQNNQGTTDIAQLNFSICDNSNLCQAGFTATPDFQGVASAVYFTNTSTITSGTINSWCWDYGDGTIYCNNDSTINNSHFYSNTGPFYVCLTIGTTAGCTSTFCDTVNLTTNNGCQTAFTVTPQNNTNTTFTFVPTSSGTAPFTHTWNFGDGPNETSSGVITHTYTTPGTYTVCVYSQDANGCIASYCQQVTVNMNMLCQTGFTPQFNGDDLNVVFVGTFDGVINNQATYSWTWGDGSTDNGGPTNQHDYSVAGNYIVCVTASYNGCTATYCDSVTVGSPGCTSSILVNPTNAPNTYEFSASMTGGTAPYFFTINYGDGPNETSSTLPFTHTYANPGTYNVCLYVSDVNNCISSSCQTITVLPNGGGCQAYFTSAGFNNPADQAIQFTDYSVSGDSLNPIIGWTWNFGDGSNSTLQNPMHDYIGSGIYYVCLTVSNNNGCQSTYCDSINVGNGNQNNIISGNVYTSVNTPASVAYVFLLRFDYPNSELVPAGAEVTNNGNYVFSNVANGNYVVKAALTPNDPLYSVRIPTYHTAALLWNFGDVISINNNSYTTGDIYMIAASNNGGPGFIGGSVDWADTLRAATDFSGATVILQTIAGENIAYTTADTDGNYSFNNLAYGTYKLYADFPGYSGDPTFVTLTPIADSVNNAQVLLGPATITSVEETSAIDGVTVFPNPTTDNATLVVETSKTAQLNLTVVNMMGQVVDSKNINAFAGKNMVQLNTDGLAQGVYTLVLRDSKGVAKAQRLIKQ